MLVFDSDYGWAVCTEDIKEWAENALLKCDNLSNEEAFKVLKTQIKHLVEVC